jgi:hypothetical protein
MASRSRTSAATRCSSAALCSAVSAGTAEGTPAPAGSSMSGDALKFGETRASVPEHVRVLRKMPASA